MVPSADLWSRSAATLNMLNQLHGWGLDTTQQEEYLRDLVPLLPDPCDDSTIAQRLSTYHMDHHHVMALAQRTSPHHNEIWLDWTRQAIRILRSHSVSQYGFSDVEDLAQLGLSALAEQLPTFRYASRFSTWAYSVITQRALRERRDERAQKRSAPITSIDQQDDDEPAHEASDPNTLDSSLMLTSLINTTQQILGQNRDERLAKVFQLWMVDELRQRDIAQILNISVSRVSTLLQQACQLLQQHPDIQTWLQDSEQNSCANDETISSELKLLDQQQKARFAALVHSQHSEALIHDSSEGTAPDSHSQHGKGTS